MFSEKYGYQIKKEIQFETISEELRKRIWNVFYSYDIMDNGLSSKRISQAFAGKRTIEMNVADKLGFMLGGSPKNSPQKLILNLILEDEWYRVLDFIEIHLSCLDSDAKIERARQYNDVLETEKSGYRVVGFEIAPIINQEEIDAIEDAMSTSYDPVSQHIKKALLLYSNRESPDYENSIKESISAVESMCCIITGLSGANATLGKTIKRLKDAGIHIHSAMESAFSQLYGYTSDEKGIRHGNIDFKEAPAEDAKYMLVSCSAFVNYLIEKKDKIE